MQDLVFPSTLAAPNKKEFQNIVKVLAEKYQVSMEEDTLLAEANKWELSHGRIIRQDGTAIYQLFTWKRIKNWYNRDIQKK